MSTETESGLPRAVAVAWGLQAEPARGPSRGVSHHQIIEAAIGIADAEGLAAVTMARVADAVGFTTMALYRYVANKDELLLLMVDAATPLAGWAEIGGSWRDGLEHWAELLRDVYRRHPWVLDVPRGQVSVLMPSSMAVVDAGLRATADLRLDDQERMALILSVSAYVTSFADLERQLGAEDELQVGPEAMAELAAVITPERLPHLAPMFLRGDYVGGADQPAAPDGPVGPEFRWGLDRLLDGLAQLHESRSADDVRS